MTPEQKEWFRNRIYGWMCDDSDQEELADTALDFIRQNLSPDEVFSMAELRHFYEDHKEQLENRLPAHY